MRNHLTICLIVFAIAVSASAAVFHSVVAAGRRIEQHPASVPIGAAELAPRAGGIPAVYDDVLL